MRKGHIKRAVSLFMILCLLLQTGFVVRANAAPVQSSGLVSLAGQIPGSVNLASKPNFNDNPYGLVVNVRRSANGNAQRIVNGFEYAQNNTGASSDVVAMHGGTQGASGDPIYVTISWPEPHVFTGTSVMWWISGQSTQSVWPEKVTIEYTTGELTPFPTQPASSNAALADRHEALVWQKVDGLSDNVGVAHNGSAPGNVNSDWQRNTLWNNYVFDTPVVARHIRLSIVVDKTGNANAGAGINLWEVYGYDDAEATELESISEGFLRNLVTDAGLPAFGAAGSDITWEVIAGNPSDFGGDVNAALAAAQAALNAATGKITRPAFGGSIVKGKIKATASGTPARTRVFDFSVLPLPNKTPQEIVDDAIAALDLGTLIGRKENFDFPAQSADGAVYTWETSSPHVWTDGTVVRPPVGQGDETGITVTVKAKFGSTESAPRTWTGISLPEYADNTRKIVSAESPTIRSPQGTAPKLPNSLEVTYNDGTSEMRKIQWSGYSTAEQTAQAARPAGDIYALPGHVIGDTADFQVTANIIVVAANDPVYGLQSVPSNIPVATALPLSAVKIDNDPNGDENRLTQNRTGDVTYIIGQDCTQYLYQFKTAYGLSTDGYAVPSGWTGKLRGAGAGHYLSALALAINSNITATQREQLVNRMARMTREMREMQELTMDIPHPTETTRKWEARDFFGPIELDGSSAGKTGDERVMSMSLLLGNWMAYAYGKAPGTYANNYTSAQIIAGAGADIPNAGPRTYGHGYLNAIPPQHLLGNECYAEYSDGGNGVWAPYYGLHKILAGLVEIYDTLNGDNTVYTLSGDYGTGTITGQAVADLALEMATDMGLWISNRFQYRTRAGVRPALGQAGHELPGWRDSNWIVFIGGEYGGMNETLARLYKITGDPRQLTAAEGFWNDGSFANTGFRPFMSDLAMNRDSIRILHANQAIPSIVGALWTYRGNNDPKYWNVAENFWEYNVGRYAWATGNVKGNPGNVEQYIGAYNQSSALMLHSNANETCAAYNLMKLSKYLNEHNPNEAKYMDEVERLFTNQIIGSYVPGSSTGQGCYHYPIHLNASKSRGVASSTNADCCSGTRAELHVRYQDDMYYTTANKKTFYVGLYLPSTARWAEQDITIKQETVWPSEKATFTFTTGSGTGQFEMKFRVPYWATKDFSIKLNDVVINNGVFEPSTYVSTGVRTWSSTDRIVVDMPYKFWIDYLPGKQNGKWLGALMYGPVLMAADGTSAAERITSYDQADLYIDSFMNVDNMDVTINARETLGTTPTGVTAITRNVPTLTAKIGDVVRPIRPHYYVASNYTTYFYINVAGGSWFVEKATLFNNLMRARELLDSGKYTEKSSRFLVGAATNGAGAYANESASAEGVVAAINAIKTAVAKLESTVPTELNTQKGLLETNVLAAKALLEENYTWNSFAALRDAISAAEAALAVTPQVLGDLLLAISNLEDAEDGLVLLTALDKDALNAALTQAGTKTNPANTGVKSFPEHDFTVYTRLSWNNFQAAKAHATDVMNNTSKNYNQSEIDAAANALNAAMLQLLNWERADERGALASVIAQAKALSPALYTTQAWDTIQGFIDTAEERLGYGSLTFIEMYALIADMRAAISNTTSTGSPTATTYTVTFNTDGGSVVSSQNVASGGKAGKPANPTKTGYVFEGWYSDAALTKSYDFSGTVSSSFTLYAKWTEATATPSFLYADVKDTDWFYDAVRFVSENGLMQGTGSDRFSPNVTLTRGMMVTMLYRLEDTPAVSGSIPFPDVKSGEWYTDAIIWASKNDIVNGYTNGTFGPDKPVTREQAVTILYRYAKAQKMDISKAGDLSKFVDVSSISNYALDAMKWAVAESIVQGRPGNRVAPQDNSSRADIAAIFKRYVEDFLG